MFAIAIDGPSGAGKSTLARHLAKELNFVYVDTGALYRAIGLYMTEHGIDPADGEAVEAALPAVKLSLAYREGSQLVFLNGEDVSAAIRRPEISMAASKVSALPPVRAFLLETQRSIARENNVIMDGRDIGTVILPGAQVKLFLESSLEDRARRRCEELAEKGMAAAYDEVLSDMIERDRRDSTRTASPAVAAPDAVHLDNSGLPFEETLFRALAVILPRWKAYRRD